MVKLGMKISKAFSKMGDKTTKAFNTLGTKTNSVMEKTKQLAGRVEDIANNTLDKTKDLNEKAINLSNNIIQKSGGITDAIRKASSIGDKLISGVVNAGGGDIPGIGSVLKIAQKGTHQLNTVAKKLDDARDTGAKKIGKYNEVSRQTIGDIEKANPRKKAEIIEAMAPEADNFA